MGKLYYFSLLFSLIVGATADASCRRVDTSTTRRECSSFMRRDYRNDCGSFGWRMTGRLSYGPIGDCLCCDGPIQKVRSESSDIELFDTSDEMNQSSGRWPYIPEDERI